MVAIKMAVESYRTRKTLLWDAKTEKVVAAIKTNDQIPTNKPQESSNESKFSIPIISLQTEAVPSELWALVP